MNTPWTDFLAREGATFENNAVRFAAAEAEARDADSRTIAVPLVHLGLIRSSGDDSATFLHNLFSNNVVKLGEDSAQWNSFNSAKGRMLANFLLWRETGGHLLALSADIHAPILKKLSMYVLRSKVKLTDGGADTVLIGVAGADATGVVERAGLPAAGEPMGLASRGATRVIRIGSSRLVVAAPMEDAAEIFAALVAAGAAKAGTAAWQLTDVRAGVPLVTTPTQEAFVAQMLNYELIGGVSFNKGCYPGQEIVARTQYLGKLKKRTYRVHIATAEAPAPATDLYAPDFGAQSAGQLVNVAPAPDGGFEALAVLQTSSAEAGEVHLGAPDGPRLTLLDLPYAVS